MNTQQHEMEARLWDYIDGLASAAEKNHIEQLIESDAQWRTTHQALMEVHTMMDEAIALDQPSMRFTQNVMEKITAQEIAPATSSYINKNIIYGLAAFFFTLIFGFLIYALAQIDWQPVAAGEGNSVSTALTKLDFSRVFNNGFVNIFMMVNIMGGLLLLDRYLASKRKRLYNNHT